MNDTPEDILLRGVVRIENVEYPSHYIAALMGKVKRHHLERTYELRGWDDYMSFLEMLARKGGRLLKGGEPDVEGVAKIVVHDFLRGKIPWFTPCPTSGDAADGSVVKGRDGKLGEMPKKRKRDGEESVGTSAMDKDEEGSDGEFGGFDSADEDEDESSDSQPDAEGADDSDEVVDRISLGGSSDAESDAEGEGDNGVEASEGILSDGDGSSEDGGVPVETGKAAQGNKRRRK